MFGRKQKRKRSWRLFFATDIHGSEQCFRKWLNAGPTFEADVLVLGGDITGKVLVPILSEGGTWSTVMHGEPIQIASEEELERFRKELSTAGFYDLIVSPEEKAALDSDSGAQEAAFRDAMKRTLERWTALADQRLENTTGAFSMLGNDDEPELADVLREGSAIKYAEDGICRLPEGRELLSFGYSTPTPWATPRELEEDEIAARLAAAATALEHPECAIFNVHCPPRDTQLDQAPKLDDKMRPVSGPGGAEMTSVGSRAVREVIEQLQPALGLHGHVHESPAVQRVGRTLCVNPGSEYPDGMLRGALIDFYEDDEDLTWQLVKG
jgi:uncharacterized protein